jgi:L-2-hydroxyglutarate oxidase
MYRFCAEENVPHRRCGKLVVAVSEDELPRLDILEERARANGVDARRLGLEEIREREPEVAGVGGLWVSETGVVNYSHVAQALARRLGKLGGEVRVRHRVVSISRRGNDLTIETDQGDIVTTLMVNCAGLQSDRVAKMAGVEPGVRIVPFRGEYYTLTQERSGLVRGLIYPVPDPALPFLGVHFTRGIGDVVEAGPNAVLALKREGYSKRDVSAKDIADFLRYPGFWRMARRQWRTGIDETLRSFSKARFLAALQKLVPALTERDIVVGGSGVRAQAVDASGRLVDDFFIQSSPQMIHVLNAPSPAATASLAIGREVAERALSQSVP